MDKLIVAVSCLSLAAAWAYRRGYSISAKSSLDEITETDETFVVAGLGPVGNTVVETLHNAGASIFLVDRNKKLLVPGAKPKARTSAGSKTWKIGYPFSANGRELSY